LYSVLSAAYTVVSRLALWYGRNDEAEAEAIAAETISGLENIFILFILLIISSYEQFA
jgi:hypothetical protein